MQARYAGQMVKQRVDVRAWSLCKVEQQSHLQLRHCDSCNRMGMQSFATLSCPRWPPPDAMPMPCNCSLAITVCPLEQQQHVLRARDCSTQALLIMGEVLCGRWSAVNELHVSLRSHNLNAPAPSEMDI